MTIDKTTSVPYHVQVRNDLLNSIRSGEYKAGDQLPSERELQEFYGISRLTVRSALADLERDGIIYSRPGKGRYVAQSYFDQQLMHLSGFTQDMANAGAFASSKVVIQSETPAPPVVATQLEIKPGMHVARIMRVRCANNEPLAIEDAYLPISLCPGIIDLNLKTGSIYNYLNSRGLRPARAIQTLMSDNPTREERQLLKLDTNIPVMRMKRKTLLPNMVPIEFTESVYRGDKYQFNVVLTLHESSSMTGDPIKDI